MNTAYIRETSKSLEILTPKEIASTNGLMPFSSRYRAKQWVKKQQKDVIVPITKWISVHELAQKINISSKELIERASRCGIKIQNSLLSKRQSEKLMPRQEKAYCKLHDNVIFVVRKSEASSYLESTLRYDKSTGDLAGFTLFDSIDDIKRYAQEGNYTLAIFIPEKKIWKYS